MLEVTSQAEVFEIPRSRIFRELWSLCLLPPMVLGAVLVPAALWPRWATVVLAFVALGIVVKLVLFVTGAVVRIEVAGPRVSFRTLTASLQSPAVRLMSLNRGRWHLVESTRSACVQPHWFESEERVQDLLLGLEANTRTFQTGTHAAIVASLIASFFCKNAIMASSIWPALGWCLLVTILGFLSARMPIFVSIGEGGILASTWCSHRMYAWSDIVHCQVVGPGYLRWYSIELDLGERTVYLPVYGNRLEVISEMEQFRAAAGRANAPPVLLEVEAR